MIDAIAHPVSIQRVESFGVPFRIAQLVHALLIKQPTMRLDIAHPSDRPGDVEQRHRPLGEPSLPATDPEPTVTSNPELEGRASPHAVRR